MERESRGLRCWQQLETQGRAEAGAAAWVTRQRNGKVSPVLVSASPSCSKLYLASKGGLPSRCRGDGCRGGRPCVSSKGVERGKEE